MKNFILIVSLFVTHNAFGQHTPFTGNNTPTWQECISRFQKIDDNSKVAKLIEMGTTDIGKPLHVLIINKDKEFSPEKFNKKKSVLFINNAIHPGEPDGVDASLIFAEEITNPKNELYPLLDSVIICIIPIYNIDGSMIRNGFSRTNQEGPAEYGFRGNAQNLDLNRDFIKCDSKNAESFTKIFQRIKPHIFIDTHVSNGADYPYTMTLISTQSNKLGGVLGEFMKYEIEPFLYENMAKTGFEMCPYVNHMGRTPDSGITDFLETPRFASGYAALFHTIGFISETHMLKPYAQRVESTYQFIVTMMKYMDANSNRIIEMKSQAEQQWQYQEYYWMNFELDTTLKETFKFKGYEAVIEPALVGNGERLRYDRNSPYTKDIPYYRNYRAQVEVEIPSYYVIPQAWSEVIDRLKWNGVSMDRMKSDTTMFVYGYYLNDLNTSKSAYEGHFLHRSVSARRDSMNIHFFEGDYIVPVNQIAIRYILETLEPQSEDSFFTWNFFDGVLQQKEWFSDYVFEEKAKEILINDPVLKSKFDEALKTDPDLEEHWMQLNWIFRNSPYFEASAFRYPVYSIK
jgi:hypothetical protein